MEISGKGKGAAGSAKRLSNGLIPRLSRGDQCTLGSSSLGTVAIPVQDPLDAAIGGSRWLYGSAHDRDS